MTTVITLSHIADTYPERLAARRDALTDELSHLDDAAVHVVVSLALASDPHLHGSYQEMRAAGACSRERAVELLAANQVAREMERAFAAAGVVEASVDARVNRACGGRA